MRTGPKTTTGRYDPEAAKLIAAAVEPSRLRRFGLNEVRSCYGVPASVYENALAELRASLTDDQRFVLTECVRAPSGICAEREHTNEYVGARAYVVCEQFEAAGLIDSTHMRGAGRVAIDFLFVPLLRKLVMELDRDTKAVAA